MIPRGASLQTYWQKDQPRDVDKIHEFYLRPKHQPSCAPQQFFWGARQSRRAIARYLSGRGGSATFQIRPTATPRKDTLRISLAQLAGLRFSALCSPNTPTSSGGKSGDHISTALILRLRAGSWAHRYVETLHCNGRSLVKKRWQSGALAPLIAFEFLNISN